MNTPIYPEFDTIIDYTDFNTRITLSTKVEVERYGINDYIYVKATNNYEDSEQFKDIAKTSKENLENELHKLVAEIIALKL